VMDVHAALSAFAQPELLVTEEQRADVTLRRGADAQMRTIVVPEAAGIPPRH
jgi:hypothetical protein